MMALMEINQIMQIIMTGIATGVGTAIGSFFATKYVLTNLAKAKELLKTPLKGFKTKERKKI